MTLIEAGTEWTAEDADGATWPAYHASSVVVAHLRVPTLWTTQRAGLYACDLASSVLPLFEEIFPNDERPREAIATARRFAYGRASLDELTCAEGHAMASLGEVSDEWSAASAAGAALGAARATRATRLALQRTEEMATDAVAMTAAMLPTMARVSLEQAYNTAHSTFTATHRTPLILRWLLGEVPAFTE